MSLELLVLLREGGAVLAAVGARGQAAGRLVAPARRVLHGAAMEPGGRWPEHAKIVKHGFVGYKTIIRMK